MNAEINDGFGAFRLDVRFGERQKATREFYRLLDWASAVELHLESGGDYWTKYDGQDAWEWVLKQENHFTQFALNDFMALG